MLLLRFGVTLPTPMRIARYARVCLPVAGCAMLLALVLPERQLATMLGQYRAEYINPSPSGRYALVFFGKSASLPSLLMDLSITDGSAAQYLLRLSDGAAWEDRLPNFSAAHWANDTQYYSFAPGWGSHVAVLSTQRLDARGSLTSQQLTVGQAFQNPLLVPSPDQRYLLIIEQAGERRLACVELPALRILPLAIKHVANYWWQSAHEIGYDDYQHGHLERHIVDLKSIADTP